MLEHTTNLRKQRTFCNATTGFSAKWHQGNKHRNSILTTCHYPDLASASDWLKQISHMPTNNGTIQPSHASLISRSVVSYLSTITPKHLKNLLKDLKPCWFRCEESWQSLSTKSTFDRQKIDKLECKVMSLSCSRPIQPSVIEPNQTATFNCLWLGSVI